MRKAHGLAGKDVNDQVETTKRPRSGLPTQGAWVLALAILISLVVHLASGVKISTYDRLAHTSKTAKPKDKEVKIKLVDKPRPKDEKRPEEHLPKILETPQEQTERPDEAQHAGTTDHKTEKETRLANKPNQERAKDAGQKGSPKATPKPVAPKKKSVTEIRPQTPDMKTHERGVKNKDGNLSFDAHRPKPRNQYEALLPTGLNDLPGQINAGYQEHLDEEIEIGDRIDINTSEYRYIGYFTSMRKAIELVWNYPLEASRKGMQGEVELEFAISKDGRASRIKVLKSSGYEVLDKAIVEAIMLASPFSPLPDGFGKERLLVTGSFRYILSSFGH